VGEGAQYAELHCHSNFSFLDGASHPDELVEEAARLRLEALAITDHDGMYGAVRFAEAAGAAGLPTVFGAEVTLGLTRAQTGVPDPEGTHLVVLARSPTGYARLCKALSAAHLLGREKGRPLLDLALLAAIGAGADLDLSTISMSDEPALPSSLSSPTGPGPRPGGAEHWAVLTGCRKGAVTKALISSGPAAARHELARLQRHFGRANVAVEIWDHGEPMAGARNDALAELACQLGANVVATNNVHYHHPGRSRLATAMAAVRGRRSLDDMDGWLPAAASAHLRSGAEQARRFARYPGAVPAAAQLGRDCAFDLRLVAPNLPPFPTPAGHTEMTWLAHLTEQGARHRYGPRHSPSHPRAYSQIDYELDMINQLGFPGYFLVVWDIVRFCNESGIYCQGRGSAANSAVCYALGITKADAVGLGLLFERFLSPERDGPPDIDVDIESGRREEAIQYVYRRYGRSQAAQVANVITYRPRSAVRDMGKALGASPGQVDSWSKCIDVWGPLPAARDGANGARGMADVGSKAGAIPEPVLALARETQDFPRHLGIHSGGMVICDRPVAEVCPVEWARMADRSVLQWDKDDCARAGLVKFDLLGLGMLSALHSTVDHVRSFYGTDIDLAGLPQDPAVYEMLCRADSVGVFQVESRAQMATLPRLRPRTFYDLVIEVALIRPGPIQGRSVHPYLRRRKGTEPVTYLHPLLERSLKKTLGVPLFQEQLMQMAIDVAGFSAAEADQLRQAMGSKRSAQRMQRLRARFYAGMAERGATGEVADRIWSQMAAFANFGFPESHSVSFAYLVYASAWLKLHYPAAFLAGLLDNQPMGFWSPQTLVLDARRHGVEVHRPDVNASGAGSVLERTGDGTSQGQGGDRTSNGQSGDRANVPAVRLGISYVRTIGSQLSERIAARRPYSGIEDIVRRAGLSVAQAEALATAGAFECFGLARREALWAAGAIAQAGPGHAGEDKSAQPAGGRAAGGRAAGGRAAGGRAAGGRAASGRAAGGRHQAARLAGLVTGTDAPPLPGMSATELNRADLWATGLSPDSYPTELLRPQLDALGVVLAADLDRLADGAAVTIGGMVTHRQRPMTAKGVVFVNLEDETGLVNVICPLSVWERFGQVARSAPGLLVRGKLEKADGAINVLALGIEALPMLAGATSLRSRDFR
jgi:error-prone DNA polymerase